MKDQPYYQSVFNHIAEQIYTGKLEVGSQLESIRSMSQKFATGENTIRAAVKMLEKNGFIQTTRGKAPVVVSVSGNRQQALKWLSAHYEQIADNYDLIQIFFPSIAAFSLKKFGPSDFAQLNFIADEMETHSGQVFFLREQKNLFVDLLLSKSENSAMKEICIGARESILLPRMASSIMDESESLLASTRSMYIRRVRTVYQYALDGKFDNVKEEIRLIYLESKKAILSMMDSFLGSQKESLRKPPELPGEFYLYDLIASDMIDKIYSGEFGLGDYLPSISSMTQSYHVSLPTVRNAYQTLNELGLAKTENGKGTQLSLYSDYSNYYWKSLEGMVMLTRLWEATQLVAVTIEDICAAASAKIDYQEAVQIENSLRSMRANTYPHHRFYPVFVLLSMLADRLNCQSFKTTCIQLKKDLIFGIYLERFYQNKLHQAIDSRYLECLFALEHLKQGNVRAFSKKVSNIFNTVMEQTRSALHQLGLSVS